MRNCPQCGAEFSRSSLRQKYCSPKCLHQANWARQKTRLSDWSLVQDKSSTCAECGCAFTRAERWQRFCCGLCKERARSKRRHPVKKRAVKQCLTCTCKQCGNAFVLDRLHRISKAKFCSPKCWYGWTRDNSTAPKGARERYRMYGGQEWTKTAASIRRRDDYVCQSCGDGGDVRSVAVDHIVPLRFATRISLKNPDINPHAEVNLVSLCASCHSQKTEREQTIHRGDTGGFFEWVALLLGRERTWNAMQYFNLVPPCEVQ